MLIRTGAITGAIVGAALAVIMISLHSLNLGRISIPLSVFIDRAIFTVCPFYALGFTNFVSNKASWFLATILGNTLLYGVLFSLVASGVVLFRRLMHKMVS